MTIDQLQLSLLARCTWLSFNASKAHRMQPNSATTLISIHLRVDYEHFIFGYTQILMICYKEKKYERIKKKTGPDTFPIFQYGIFPFNILDMLCRFSFTVQKIYIYMYVIKF